MAQGAVRADGDVFERQEAILAQLGENVLIALYCGRDREARHWMGQARRVLDRDHYRRLMEMKRRVEPGALPVDVPPGGSKPSAEVQIKTSSGLVA